MNDETYHAYVHAPFYSPYQRLLQRSKPHRSSGNVLYVLQLLSYTFHVTSYPGDGRATLSDHVSAVEELCSLLPKPALSSPQIHRVLVLKLLSNFRVLVLKGKWPVFPLLTIFHRSCTFILALRIPRERLTFKGIVFTVLSQPF